MSLPYTLEVLTLTNEQLGHRRAAKRDCRCTVDTIQLVDTCLLKSLGTTRDLQDVSSNPKDTELVPKVTSCFMCTQPLQGGYISRYAR